MADYVRVPLSDWQDICDAVREKTGGEEKLLSGEVAPGVRGIKTEPTLQDITITENGTYTADEGHDGLGKVTVEVLASGDIAVETGELTLTGWCTAANPLTIPVSAKHSHLVIVPKVLSTFLMAVPAVKYQYMCYAAENYGYIGASVHAGTTEAGTRGTGASYWQDETQTTYRADFTDTEITLYPDAYAAFGYAGFEAIWMAW